MLQSNITLDQGLQSEIYGPRPVGPGPKNEKYKTRQDQDRKNENLEPGQALVG